MLAHRSTLAALSLVVISFSGCDDRSRVAADTTSNYEVVAIDNESDSIQEQKKELALERLRLAQEFEVRELKAKHAEEIAALTQSNRREIERLKATHASETKALTEAHEKAVADLKSEHQREVSELTAQVSMREWIAIVTGALVVLSWAGFSVYFLKRRKMDAEVESAAAAWRASRRVPPSVVDSFASRAQSAASSKQ